MLPSNLSSGISKDVLDYLGLPPTRRRHAVPFVRHTYRPASSTALARHSPSHSSGITSTRSTAVGQPAGRHGSPRAVASKSSSLVDSHV